MGLTVKRNDRLEKLFDQFTVQPNISEEEKEKKKKFLDKDNSKNKKDAKK